MARLLDVGKAHDSIVQAVNELLFNLASNVAVLREILRFASESGPTTQRWLVMMLTMLSSEPSWLEESFATYETPHNYVRMRPPRSNRTRAFTLKRRFFFTCAMLLEWDAHITLPTISFYRVHAAAELFDCVRDFRAAGYAAPAAVGLSKSHA